MAGSNWERLYKMPFAKGYAGLVAKAEAKGRRGQEVDEVIRWLTGYSQGELEAQIERKADFETFFAEVGEAEPVRRHDLLRRLCSFTVQRLLSPRSRRFAKSMAQASGPPD